MAHIGPPPEAGSMRSSRVLSGRRWAVGAVAALAALFAAGVPTGAAGAAPADDEFHAYSIAYQTADHLTGVRARFNDFAPNYPLDPSDHSDDVNGAIWLILGSGTSLEIGYTVIAVGEPGTFEAYRYVEINRPTGQQRIVAMDQRGHVTSNDAASTGVYDTFPADSATHSYAIVREKRNAHVWDFLLDNHVVYRYTTGHVESGKTLEAGIETYHPDADVMATFGSLGKQRNGGWTPWKHQQVLVQQPHLAGYWTGSTAWTATEHS
jgi:hypothetical protein